jgi:hypothetical protein
MSAGRKKQHQRKRPLRPISPRSEAASDLCRWIEFLTALRSHRQDLPVWGQRGEDDDPLGELIACLKQVLAGRDAAEVFDPSRRSGRRKSHHTIHIAIASAYWRIRGPAKQQGKVIRYALSPTKACEEVRMQRKEWGKYSDKSIRRWAHKYRGLAVLDAGFTSLDT